MSSKKRKVAPSPKAKGPRSTPSYSESESSLPSRYYSGTTAASSSVALSDTDASVTNTGHRTQSLYDWTPSEQSITVDLSDSETDAPPDSKSSSTSCSSDVSDEERRKPWWKRKRVMLGVVFTVAGLCAVILGATLTWAFLSPKAIDDDEIAPPDGYFVGPYEARSLSERIADKHTNRGRLYRPIGRSFQQSGSRSNGKPREYLSVKKKNPHKKLEAGKRYKNKMKDGNINGPKYGKMKQKGRFLGFGTAEPRKSKKNKYLNDELERRKQLKHNNKALDTGIRNFTNPVGKHKMLYL